MERSNARVLALDTRQESFEKALASLLVEMRERFDYVDERFNAMDKRFDSIDERFNADQASAPPPGTSTSTAQSCRSGSARSSHPEWPALRQESPESQQQLEPLTVIPRQMEDVIIRLTAVEEGSRPSRTGSQRSSTGSQRSSTGSAFLWTAARALKRISRHFAST